MYFGGAIPGIGAAVIDWLAYILGIFFSKDKQGFGQGSFDGVLFAESAQNAKESEQAVPTLAFGIPGGVAWALVLAGMLAFNVSPGPAMFDEFAHLTIALVLTLGIGNLLITFLGLMTTSHEGFSMAKIPIDPGLYTRASD